MNDKIIVGQFGSVYGIQGWIRVNSFTEPGEQILNYTQWLVDHQGEWQEIKLSEHKLHGQQVIVKLAHCAERELVRHYTNNLIAIPRQQLPVLNANEFYWADFVGVRVINQQGQDLGCIDHLMSTGANDVFVINGERQRLLPYTDEVVKSIDLVQKIMKVDWDADF